MALFQVGLLSIVLSATLCQGRPQWQNKHTENGGILAPEDKMYRADNLEDFKDADFAGARFTRSLSQLGNAAVRTLLRGAKRSKSQGIGYVTYEKQGSYRTALGEFYDLKPTAIQKKTIRRTEQLRGMVGNRSIRLIEIKQGGGPSILISNPKTGGVEVKIIYKMQLD